MEQREANGQTGVVFTAEDREAVRQWVQTLSTHGEIVATETKLYLPIGTSGMDEVFPGDTIWFDPELTLPNPFSLERA